MSRLPLHTLPSFRVIARTGNLRAAAEELHLTHSAVSQQFAPARNPARLRAVRPTRAPHRAQSRGLGAAAGHRPGARPDRRRRALSRGRRFGCAAAPARQRAAVVRAALAAAAHGALARPAPRHRARAPCVAATGRSAARGLPRCAAPGPRPVARSARRAADRFAADRGRLGSRPRSACSGATWPRWPRAAARQRRHLGALVRAVGSEGARAIRWPCSTTPADAAGRRAEPRHRLDARAAGRRRIARAALVPPVIRWRCKTRPSTRIGSSIRPTGTTGRRWRRCAAGCTSNSTHRRAPGRPADALAGQRAGNKSCCRSRQEVEAARPRPHATSRRAR